MIKFFNNQLAKQRKRAKKCGDGAQAMLNYNKIVPYKSKGT
jgi:hypothetical protein